MCFLRPLSARRRTAGLGPLARGFEDRPAGGRPSGRPRRSGAPAGRRLRAPSPGAATSATAATSLVKGMIEVAGRGSGSGYVREALRGERGSAHIPLSRDSSALNTSQCRSEGVRQSHDEHLTATQHATQVLRRPGHTGSSEGGHAGRTLPLKSGGCPLEPAGADGGQAGTRPPSPWKALQAAFTCGVDRPPPEVKALPPGPSKGADGRRGECRPAAAEHPPGQARGAPRPGVLFLLFGARAAPRSCREAAPSSLSEWSPLYYRHPHSFCPKRGRSASPRHPRPENRCLTCENRW